jgi:hypothetical protein
MIVQEFTAIVRMQFADREREPRENAPKAALHRALTAPKHGHAFAPAGGHVDHLERVDVVAARLGTAMMHQVDLKMAWHGFVPGDCPHGNAAHHAISLFGAAARQARRTWMKRVSRRWTLATLMWCNPCVLI